MEAQARLAGPWGHGQLPACLGMRQSEPSLLSWAYSPHLSLLKGKDDSYS